MGEGVGVRVSPPSPILHSALCSLHYAISHPLSPGTPYPPSAAPPIPFDPPRSSVQPRTNHRPRDTETTATIAAPGSRVNNSYPRRSSHTVARGRSFPVGLANSPPSSTPPSPAPPRTSPPATILRDRTLPPNCRRKSHSPARWLEAESPWPCNPL